MIKQKVKEYYFGQMEINMKDILLMENIMGLVLKVKKMEVNMKETLKMMNMKDMELKLLLGEKNMKENFTKETYMERVYFIFQMAVPQKEHGIMEIKMESLKRFQKMEK